MTASSPGTPRFTWWYLFISALFIALGGSVAVAWNDNHALKCLSIGVALPIIISSLASQLPK